MEFENVKYESKSSECLKGAKEIKDHIACSCRLVISMG